MEYFTPITGALGYEEISCTISTAVGLTVANITAAGPNGRARVMVTTYPVATRVDGTAPTSITKQTWDPKMVLWLEGYEEMKNFKGIGIGGTSVLAVQYYKYDHSN